MILESILELAERERIPAWGIGPASRMSDEAPGHRPEDLMPGAQSLICFAIPVPAQVYHMPSYAVETTWRSQNLYYRRLDTLSLQVAALLEEYGQDAVPVFGCMPLGMNERGVVVGYLNLIRMGEITGIGIIGRNGLLLHSHYGARLMLGGVVTSASLPEMCYPLINEPGCPADCRICADACPVKAISAETKRVNVMRCLSYTARTPLMSRLKFAIMRAYRVEAAARLMNLYAFDEHTFHVCSRCVALCPYGNGNALGN